MWEIKVLIQFVLSKLPMGERINFLLQRLNKSRSLQKSEDRIIELSKNLENIKEFIKLENSTVVEIGTGWDAINPILLYVMGTKICHTYDHVRHVRFELAKLVVNAINNQIEKISEIISVPINTLKERVSIINNANTIDELFLKANIIYHAPGDATKTGLEDNSVDLVYSYAVLEHIPKEILYSLAFESKRILKNSGFSYHIIGLHDHYVSFDKKITKVNFLKYPEWLWAFFVHNKISHHNRLREKQFLELWESCGAKINWSEHKIDEKDIDTLRNMKIDKFFDGMTFEELAVYLSKVIFSFPKKDNPLMKAD